MKLKHEKSLLSPDKFISSQIEHICFSPNMTKLAICSYGNNHVTFFDGQLNEKKEKFALKAVAKEFSRKSFAVKGIAFSADSTKFAVGQTDCVIYVYKIGENLGDKKAIVGKYTLPNPVTCLLWNEFGIIFGSFDGKVKILQTQTNKMINLLSSNAMVISLSVCGDNVVAGFVSGNIMLNTISSKDSVGRQIAVHSCPPFALALSQSGFVFAGGCDGRASFINTNTNQSASSKQNVELNDEISCAVSSPSGNVIIISLLYKLLIFEIESRVWRQTSLIELKGAYLITGLHWSKDGTKVVIGTVNGGLEVFSCKWKKKLIGDKLEINYVGNKQVVVKDLTSGTSSIFSSNFDIRNVKVYKDFYIVVWTSNTLIIGNIENADSLTSEVDWTGMATEGIKFYFDYEKVALINVAGELYLVELGSNQFLASVRTDYVNPHLMSVCINERKSQSKVFAYLLDLKTISILDLNTNIQICIWSHDLPMNWIELNEVGKKLLFRDKSLRLYLLDIPTQETFLLLNLCGFVQWVPGSDVVVAQSKEKVYIWYDYNKPVIHEVIGGQHNEVTGIERANGMTKVTFTNASSEIVLDEVLLEFDTAIEDGDLERAVLFLENYPLSAESESMWRILGNVALKSSNLFVAERAFAEIGDITRASFVRECFDDPIKLALLENDWNTFETEDFDQVIETYIKLHKWEKAIDFALRLQRIDVKEDLEKRFYQWLLDSGQEAEAGIIMEKSGKIEEAIRLFLKAGRSIQAFKIVINKVNKRDFDLSKSLVETVIKELVSAEFYEEAGQLTELPLINDKSLALEYYVKGNAFSKAIELARKEFPDEVVGLELKYADWLMSECRDAASAVSHFIEAGKTEKALEAAIQANQYDRAAEIAAILDSIPQHFGKKIANYYASKDQVDTAVEIYLNCGCIREAVSLLNNRGQFARAYKLAKNMMDPSEAKEMYASIAKSLENEGKYKEAEKIYLTCDDADSAISMYKNANQFNSMIRLVKQFHPDLLKDTQIHLAKELENEKSFHQAETHYVAASDWEAAVQMYKNADLWEEAYRVSRTHGGANASKNIAYQWAMSLNNPEAAVKLLSRFGLLNQVVDFAVESHDFNFAKDLIMNSGQDMKFKLSEVKLKYALWLEDQEQFADAELMFIEAGKPKEAVLMYLHNNNYEDALRVAEEFVPEEDCARDVLTAQAKNILEKDYRNYDKMMKAESLLLRAGRIEVAVKFYKENNMWDEAIRVCEQYAPNLVDAVKREMITNEGRFAAESTGRSSSRSSRSMKYSETSSINETGDFRQLLLAAEQNGDKNSVSKYALLIASQLIKERSNFEALQLLNKYNSVFVLNETKKVIIRIASEIFAFDSNIEPNLTMWKLLRDSLFQVSSSGNRDEIELIEKYLFISHLFTLKTILNELKDQTNLAELCMKITISLLRYTDVVRVDKAFYEAGKVTKENGKLQMGFVFWNHFLDLVEAIEEGQLNVDHSDFVGTDIPFEVPLPSQQFYPENVIEDVKNWILQISMDSTVEQFLPSDQFRDGNVYEASLINADSTRCLPCLITGYPVIQHKMLEFKPQKYAANKDDWNKLLMITKITSSEELKEVLHFIGRICGNATIARFSFQ